MAQRRSRELFPVEGVGFAIAVTAVGVLVALLPDTSPLDALACVRFYLAFGACAP